jgi:ABC-type antimicrobial peptide transport system permease subunit
LSAPPVPESYVPHGQVAADSMGIAVRTEGEPGALLPAVRQRVAAIDPDIPIVRPQPMHAALDASAGSMRLSSLLTSGFALVAALLASIGIYSLVSYSVEQRTREIGIRVALGASPGSVMRLVVGEGLVLAGFGLALGLAGTFMAIVVVTAAASFVPALRVTRVDPTMALRAE